VICKNSFTAGKRSPDFGEISFAVSSSLFDFCKISFAANFCGFAKLVSRRICVIFLKLFLPRVNVRVNLVK
jgi:hypothetical protein